MFKQATGTIRYINSDLIGFTYKMKNVKSRNQHNVD